jgi:hypothetical protein
VGRAACVAGVVEVGLGDQRGVVRFQCNLGMVRQIALKGLPTIGCEL